MGFRYPRHSRPALATDQLASYRTAVDDYLGMLAEHRHALVPGQYERDLPLYQALRQRLA